MSSYMSALLKYRDLVFPGSQSQGACQASGAGSYNSYPCRLGRHIVLVRLPVAGKIH